MSHPSRTRLIVFLAACTIAILFAIYTNHVWEDFYITYRSSKNLATGHGLVFNIGDRLHTFTSPLGVLLPALASLLAGNTSDTTALWIFRAMCIAAFGGAATLLAAGAQARRWSHVAIALLAAWLITDAKSVDFTINGMETGLLLFFLAYSWWALTTTGQRRVIHLGAAWAGVMWTRPDGCIYIALLGIATLIFLDAGNRGETRRQVVAAMVKAGMLCALLYLPWLLWAWGYYGTPIPNTITAKSAVSSTHSLPDLLKAACLLPVHLWKSDMTALEAMFLPSYFILGDWPVWTILLGRITALAAALVWLCPGIDRSTRAASLIFYGGAYYLTTFPYFPFPWYLPGVALFGFIALAGAFSQLTSWSRVPTAGRRVLCGLAAASLCWAVWMLLASGRQLESQQRLVETGVRRKIGEWLHDHAAPGDTVFTESLGYIGFFSDLKTYDFPGMSSREMVTHIRTHGSGWDGIISALAPKWVVLRPHELERVPTVVGQCGKLRYERVVTFDNRAAILAADIRGRGYLKHDSTFHLYRLVGTEDSAPSEGRIVKVALLPPTTHNAFDIFSPLPVRSFSTFSYSRADVDGCQYFSAHPTSRQWFAPPAPHCTLHAEYMIHAAAYENRPRAEATNGVDFALAEIRPDGSRRPLFHRLLNPYDNAADRGLQTLDLDLEVAPDSELLFETTPGPDNNWSYDWALLKSFILIPAPAR